MLCTDVQYSNVSEWNLSALVSKVRCKVREEGGSIVLQILSYLKTYTLAHLKFNFHPVQIKSQKRVLDLDFTVSSLFGHLWSKQTTNFERIIFFEAN